MKEDDCMKILLVDDNPIFLEGLKNLLEATDAAEICTALNGREALEKASCFAPDAVLMDAEMNPFSGVETARLLLRKNTRLKIILMSERKVDVGQIKCCGAVGILDKNMGAKALFELLGRMERDGPKQNEINSDFNYSTTIDSTDASQWAIPDWRKADRFQSRHCKSPPHGQQSRESSET